MSMPTALLGFENSNEPCAPHPAEYPNPPHQRDSASPRVKESEGSLDP